jgi:hypothetical protein
MICFRLLTITARKLQSLECIRDARIRVDRASSDAERSEALVDYDRAINDFRRLIRITGIDAESEDNSVK